MWHFSNYFWELFTLSEALQLGIGFSLPSFQGCIHCMEICEVLNWGMCGCVQPKEYETRVQVIQRYPEMRTVEKTDYVKEIVNEERTIIVPKTRVVMDEVQHVDRVPIIRDVPKARIEIVHR